MAKGRSGVEGGCCRRASRNENLDHLPHEEVVIEPESTVCPCCGGELHEDASKRLRDGLWMSDAGT
jgi:hypothetical protein